MFSTEQGNKLIAEFMGMDYTVNNKQKKWVPYTSCNFHQSWSLLMVVVDKIDSLLGDNDAIVIGVRGSYIDIYSGLTVSTKPFEPLSITGYGETRIEGLWKCVCEFITWYNENK